MTTEKRYCAPCVLLGDYASWGLMVFGAVLSFVSDDGQLADFGALSWVAGCALMLGSVIKMLADELPSRSH